MVTAARPPRRDHLAIAGSIALHLCVLALLVTLPRPSFPVDDPDERVRLTSIVRVEHHAPPRVVKTQRALPPSAVANRSVPLPVIHAAVTHEHAARRLLVASEERAGSGPAPTQSHVPATERLSAPVAAAVAAPPAAVEAASATAAPSPAPSPVVAQHEEGIGNFSETYPASIDPSARGALLAGVNGVIVRITVDENGRATAIEFVRAPADATLREEVRGRLLTARFIPAACNGLRCAGTVELRS